MRNTNFIQYNEINKKALLVSVPGPGTSKLPQYNYTKYTKLKSSLFFLIQ